MARISTYNLDNTVSKNDKVIGTDSSGSSTKNFKLSDVIQLVNDSGLLNIGDLLTFQYNTNNSYGSLNLTTGGPSFSTISEITVSHSDLSNQNINFHSTKNSGSPFSAPKLHFFSPTSTTPFFQFCRFPDLRNSV